MQKVIFDIEDRPPPSYYKEMAKIKLETGPVVIDKVKDKADWVNAPEFIPRSLQNYSENIENYTMHKVNDVRIYPKDVHQMEKLQQQFLQRNALLQRAAQLSALPQQFNAAANGGYPTPILINGMPHLVPRAVVQPQVQFMAHRPQFQQPLLRLQVNGMQRQMPVPMIPTSLPAGYTANVTTIKSAFGSQVPAIVIKKKRKKKPKLKNEENEQAVEKSKDHNDNCTAIKESSPEDFSLATESLNDAISIHTDDESPDLDSSHHHEDHQEQSQQQQPTIRTGSAGELQREASANGNYFPADLDLIQTAGKCAILTGSWPDLSQPQKDSLTSALSPMHSDFYGAYYENRQIAFNPESNESLTKEAGESVQLLTRNNNSNSNAYDIQKRPIIVQSIGNETRSQIADPQNDILGFIPYQLRALSMPDVHVIADKAPKMCCSIM